MGIVLKENTQACIGVYSPVLSRPLRGPGERNVKAIFFWHLKSPTSFFISLSPFLVLAHKNPDTDLGRRYSDIYRPSQVINQLPKWPKWIEMLDTGRRNYSPLLQTAQSIFSPDTKADVLPTFCGYESDIFGCQCFDFGVSFKELVSGKPQSLPDF